MRFKEEALLKGRLIRYVCIGTKEPPLIPIIHPGICAIVVGPAYIASVCGIIIAQFINGEVLLYGTMLDAYRAGRPPAGSNA